MLALLHENGDERLLLESDPLENGTQPENRVVVGGVSWTRYLEWDKALGDDRPGPRFYYLDEELEIMTTSGEHERIKNLIIGFVEDYFFEAQVEFWPRGQATMRLKSDAGAEPDASWCVGEEGTYPDIVLEIALSSGGINKLKVYQRFKIPEVWIWRKDALHVFALQADGSGYASLRKSALFATLDLDAIARCLTIESYRDARRAFRETLRNSS